MLYNRRAASIVWRARGVKVDAIKDLKATGQAFTRALKFDPGNVFALKSGARSGRAVGDPDAALADLAAVVALDPTNAEACMMHATIQLSNGKPQAVAVEAAEPVTAVQAMTMCTSLPRASIIRSHATTTR